MFNLSLLIMLRSNFQIFPPSDSIPSRQMVACSSVEVTKDIKSKSGDLISTSTSRKAVFRPLDDAELQHHGLTFSMFSLEALQSAGVNLQEFNRPFYGTTLDERGVAVDSLNNFDYSQLESIPNQNSETINFN